MPVVAQVGDEAHGRLFFATPELINLNRSILNCYDQSAVSTTVNVNGNVCWEMILIES